MDDLRRVLSSLDLVEVPDLWPEIERRATAPDPATQRGTGRFQSMFSATKYVVAGVIVALFGGFLLAGVLTQPSEEAMPAVGASASATPDTEQAEPTPADLPAGAFSSVESLTGAPIGTATLLQDGRVLLVDGVRAEVWDPATGVLSAAGETPVPRDWDFHSAVTLTDGRALIVGGDPEYGNVQAEVWDPATGSFSPAGAFSEWHSTERPSLTLLPDGRVLEMGGGTHHSDASQVVELWEPESETFRVAGEMSVARTEQTATLLQDGRVLVVGGETTGPGREAGLSPLTSAEIWDPLTESFSPAGSLVQGRALHTATLLPDGRVLIIGGGDTYGSVASPAEMWDPATEAFSPAGWLIEARYAHSATLLPDGRVLVIGGWGDGGDVASAEIWDPVTGSFSPAGSLVHPRGWHWATLLPDGRVLVTGRGSSAEIWEPTTSAQTDTSTTTPELLPGVDLVTEEVEPGVYRVTSDGVRDLVRLPDRDHWTFGILDGNVVAGLDGSVWSFDRDGFFRLGEETVHPWPKGLGENHTPGLADIEVGPDGTAWLTGWFGVPGKNAHVDTWSYDGQAWSSRWQGAAGRRWALDVEVQQDGTVWMARSTQKGEDSSFVVRAARLGDDGWQILPGGVNAGGAGHGGDVILAEGGGSDAWLMSGEYLYGPLYRHDGDGWVVVETPEIGGAARAAVGPDGTLWVRLKAGCDPEFPMCGGVSDILARFDGGDWVAYDSSDGIPMMGDHYQGFEGFFAVAPDHSIWFNPNGDYERTGTECDGIVNFDGEAITYYLRDMCIYAMDLAPDGTVWLQAGEYRADVASGQRLGKVRPGPIHTYVITPEAVAVAE